MARPIPHSRTYNMLLVFSGLILCYLTGRIASQALYLNRAASITKPNLNALDDYVRSTAWLDSDLVSLLQGLHCEIPRDASVVDCLAAIEAHSHCERVSLATATLAADSFGILETPSKAFLVVAGQCTTENGATHFQLVSPSRLSTTLVERDTLLRDGFEALSVIQPLPEVASESKSIRVSFDKPWINLGIDNGSEETRAGFVRDPANGQLVKQCNVTLTNQGVYPVIVEEVASSCGCLAINGKGSTKLAPNEKHTFDLKANMGGSASYSHSVLFLLGDSSGDRLACRLHVFGNRILGHETMSVTSAQLGELRPDRSRPFVFSLYERPNDRFRILGTSLAEDVFYSASVQSTLLPNNLLRHDITLEPLDYGSLVELYGAGDRPLKGLLKIETSSSKSPIVLVDVHAVLVGQKHRTRTLAIGRVHIDKPHRIAIPATWTSDGTTIADVMPLGELQSGIKATLARGSDGKPVAFTVTFTEGGIIEQRMTCRRQSASGESSDLEFVLLAFVSPSDND